MVKFNKTKHSQDTFAKGDYYCTIWMGVSFLIKVKKVLQQYKKETAAFMFHMTQLTF